MAAMTDSNPVRQDDKCARCGRKRGDHDYNGTAYGVCGEFVPPTRDGAEGATEADDDLDRARGSREYPSAPPKPAPAPDAVRDRFEAWAISDHRGIRPLEGEERTDANNHYYEADTDNAAFIGWKAALSAPVPSAGGAGETTPGPYFVQEGYPGSGPWDRLTVEAGQPQSSTVICVVNRQIPQGHANANLIARALNATAFEKCPGCYTEEECRKASKCFAPRAIRSASPAVAAEPVSDERVRQLAARLISYVQARPGYNFDLLLTHVSESLATFAIPVQPGKGEADLTAEILAIRKEMRGFDYAGCERHIAQALLSKYTISILADALSATTDASPKGDEK